MIDPTYLRAIREGLLNGKLENANETELPEGSTELFDKDLFVLISTINEKQELLNFFTAFALLQKEVSPEFIAGILDMEEEQVLAFIYKYNKWFTAAGNNQFRLCHDRFRVCVLEKITPKTFSLFNDKLIKICNQAITSVSNDEKEWYALAYLSTHLYAKAMLEGDGSQMKQYAYNTTIWERQIKASKCFEWTKKMLEEMMQWACKYDEEEIIECALNKVDLYHQEQNDASRIVELVANGDIEKVLQRIAAFGGDDKEGLQRKFILYMLCLLELTFLESKNKPFRKVALEKILKHLDNNIPSYQPKLFDWNDFFSSYLVFKLVCEWESIGLNYDIILRSTSNWKLDWISKKSLSIYQFEVLLKIAKSINKGLIQEQVIRAIIVELANKSEIDKAIELAGKLSKDDLNIVHAIACFNNSEFENALHFCSKIKDLERKTKFIKDRVLILLANKNITDAIQLARSLPKCQIKSIILYNIGLILFSEDKKDWSEILIQESIQARPDLDKFIYTNSKHENRNELFRIKYNNSIDRICHSAEVDLIMEMVDFVNFSYALIAAEKLVDVYLCFYAKCKLAVKMAIEGRQEEAYQIYLQVIDRIDELVCEAKKHIIIKCCIEGFSHLGKIDEGVLLMQKYCLYDLNYLLISHLTDDLQSCFNLLLLGLTTKKEIDLKQKNKLNYEISFLLLRQGNFEKSIEIANQITHEKTRLNIIESIAAELLNINNFDEVLDLIKNTSTRDNYNKWILLIVDKLLVENKLELAATYSCKTKSKLTKSLILEKISIELAKQGKLEQSYELVEKITTNEIKQTVLKSLAFELLKKDEIETSLQLNNRISNRLVRDESFYSMAIFLVEKCRIEEAFKLIQLVEKEEIKYSIISSIAFKLLESSKLKEATDIVKKIFDTQKKDKVISEIAIYLAETGQFLESVEIISAVFNLDMSIKTSIKIAMLINEKGNIELAKKILLNSYTNTRNIKMDVEKIFTLTELSVSLNKVGLEPHASTMLQEVILLAESIRDIPNSRHNIFNYNPYYKSDLLQSISIILTKNGNRKAAYDIMDSIKYAPIETKTIEEICIILISQNNTDEIWFLFERLNTKSQRRIVEKMLESDTIFNDLKLWESLLTHPAWGEYIMESYSLATKRILLNRDVKDAIKLISELTIVANKRHIYNCLALHLSIEDMDITTVKTLLKSSYLNLKSTVSIVKLHYLNQCIYGGLTYELSWLSDEKYIQILDLDFERK